MVLLHTFIGLAKWILFWMNFLVAFIDWFWIDLSRHSVVHFVFMTGLPCQGFMFLVLVLVVWPHFGIPFFLIVVAPFIPIPRRDLLPSLLVATIINCRHILTLWRFRFVCQRAEVDWISGPMASIMKSQCTAPIQRGMLFISPVSFGIRLLHIDLLQRCLGRIIGSHCSATFSAWKDRRFSSSKTLNFVWRLTSNRLHPEPYHVLSLSLSQIPKTSWWVKAFE